MMSSLLAETVTGSSAFLGAAMPKMEACQARVSMGFSRQNLEKKPLALLRVIAIQQGVKGATKQDIINALSGISSYSYSAPSYSAPSYSAPSASGTPSQYQSMSLGELRALAKAQGLRGDTKAELIKLLLAAGPAPSASYSAPSYSAPAPAAAAPGLPKATLERKSLAELRAMARVRGLRGDTKQELVKLLSAGSSTGSPSAANGAAYSNGASYSNGAAAASPAAVRQLATKSLSQLRAMAQVKGIRGVTKDDLVRKLAATL